jgi:dihydrofolate reductase
LSYYHYTIDFEIYKGYYLSGEKMQKRAIIATLDRHGCIPISDDCFGRLQEERIFFQRMTTSYHHIVMGRKKIERLPPSSRPLAGRMNIILSNTKKFKDHGCLTLPTVESVLSIFANSKICIVGGADIFHLFFPYVNQLFITHIDAELKMESSDGPFPEIGNEWKTRQIKMVPANDVNAFATRIVEYTR